MRKAFIVSSPNAYRMNLDLVAVAIEDMMRSLGFDVLHLTRDSCPAPASCDDDIFFFIQRCVPEAFRKSPGTKIAYNFHPTCPGDHYGKHARRNFEDIVRESDRGSYDLVFEYNPHTCAWLQEAGVPAVFVPVGYHDRFDNLNADVSSPRLPGKTVSFIGNAKSSRRDLVKACGAEVFTECWGLDRVAYTRIQGVHLSLASYNPFRTCLTLRLIVLLASNMLPIVHEKTDWCPLTHGKHCLIGTAKQLPGLVRRLQDNPLLRLRLASAAFDFVRENHRFDHSFLGALRSASLI